MSVKLITNDYDCGHMFLLNKRENSAMEIRRLGTLALEIIETSNNLNPNLIKDIFHFFLHIIYSQTIIQPFLTRKY